MKIAILNGSPKGATSVTMQYVLFLQKKSPQHEFRFVHVCHDIKSLEEDDGAFRDAVAVVDQADAVVWATPVYVLLVPGPYKRFIELVNERSAGAALAGKYATALTTSVRFYDHTAHDYLGAVSDDLGMRYVGGYSAEMYDLVEEREQRRLAFFWESFLDAVQARRPTQRRHAPIDPSALRYEPGPAAERISNGGQKVVVFTDAGPNDTNLQNMVARFCGAFTDPVELVNLREIRMRGGCLGCLRCSFDNVCVYRNADDVYEAYRKMRDADIVVQAGTIKDRFLSARWKTFWDRRFFNNHMPLLTGKQTAYLVSGPLAQIAGLGEVLAAAADVEGANLAGIVTDECDNSRELDGLLDALPRRLVTCAEAGYVRPATFLGKGGKKVLRDEIWGSLRSVFPADHRYFKRHGLYDFPRRSLGKRAADTVFALLFRIPAFRKNFQSQIKEGMIRPLVKVLDKL